MPTQYTGMGTSLATALPHAGGTLTFQPFQSVMATLSDSVNSTFRVGDNAVLTTSSAINVVYEGAVSYNGQLFPVVRYSSNLFLVVGVDASGSGTYSSVPYACFVAGTRIQTARGEVAVERLITGDRVMARFGGWRAVRWIGVQTVSGQFLANGGAPVRFTPGSLADGAPCRDLLVSPDHSVVVGDYLVPAHLLVNGVTVVQDKPPEHVAYYHVDLGVHDCVRADGAWAESYAEQDNRRVFDNAASYQPTDPDGVAVWQPMCMEQAGGTHPALQHLRAALVARIPSGFKTLDPDLHLVADGVRVDPVRMASTSYVFKVPHRSTTIRLRSRAAVPARLGLTRDDRRLGFKVERVDIQRGGRRLPAGAADLDGCAGVYPPEVDGLRWTDGDATLPARVARCSGANLTITGYGVACYVLEPGALGRAHSA